MKRTTRQRQDNHYLPATKLAAMGYCETAVVLAKQYGPLQTKAQQASREAGRREHERFDNLVQAQHNQVPSDQDKRCFIATAVYGAQDGRTQQLRDWRDDVLQKTGLGRLLVRIYYRLSPAVAAHLLRWPWLQAPVRYGLDLFRHGLTDAREQGEHHERKYRGPG